MIQTLLRSILWIIAKTILIAHKPYILWVTGTVGKTTITSHIWKFLTDVYGPANVQYSRDHYNGEFGLPLTIIGEKTWWKNIFRWFYVFCKWIIRIFLPYPKYLVLEYGIDHVWEMGFLLSLALPDIAILSEVAPNHMEQFGTLEVYRREKLLLVQNAKYAIVHNSHRQYIDRGAIFYGIWAMSDIDVSHMNIDITGTHARINIGKVEQNIELPAFGMFHIENILPLYIIAQVQNIELEKVKKYTSTYQPESWRSWLLAWMNDSVIVDGSYNGGYLSIREGISSILPLLTTHRAVFLIWDMRELGMHAKEMHQTLAQDINNLIPRNAQVVFYCVWPLMAQHFVPEISGFPVHQSLSSIQAGRSIKELLKSTPTLPTIIYVKWSQNTIFLEEGIKEFLKKKEDKHVLCRQSPEWIKKKEMFFKSLGE